MSHAAKAILPAIGIHADNSSIAYPSIKVISKLSGIKSKTTIIAAISSLISLNLILKHKTGRRNTYILKPPAIYQGGSYYPMTEEFIRNRWRDLYHIEKAVFGVLAVKATINKPELIIVGDPDIFGAGYIQKKQFIRLAGISFPSWDTAIIGLVKKEYIVLEGENEYVIYK